MPPREAPGRRVETIFFGGGTPSLMAPETVAAVIERSRRCGTPARRSRSRWRPTRPRSRPASFAGLGAAGVNRVSLGVQALEPRRCASSAASIASTRRSRRDRDGAPALRALFLRSDLCPARPDGRRLAGRAASGRWPRRRPSVALSAHHRARHALLRRRMPAAASPCRTRRRRRAMFELPRRGSPPPGCRPTRSPTMPGRARHAAIT